MTNTNLQPATDRYDSARYGSAPGDAAWWYTRVKAVADVVLGVLLLLPAFPVILALMALVRLTSPGPGLYRQVRLGRHGRRFVLYKVRTMAHDCERHTGPRWSIPGDPRITPLGRLLRATHLDELPQLVNVVRGEMSLVGPRPERPELYGPLEAAAPGYRQRLAVLPGVTGLAQVQLPPDSDLPGVSRKLACDLCYIAGMGPGLDLRVLVATALKVVGVPRPLIRRALALPGVDSLAGAAGFAPQVDSWAPVTLPMAETAGVSVS
jgi:lipopolysaccharide/colanic/teichoic acid biosynthesis glycosyltransferase